MKDYKEIAKMFNLSESTIRRIAKKVIPEIGYEVKKVGPKKVPKTYIKDNYIEEINRYLLEKSSTKYFNQEHSDEIKQWKETFSQQNRDELIQYIHDLEMNYAEMKSKYERLQKITIITKQPFPGVYHNYPYNICNKQEIENLKKLHDCSKFTTIKAEFL